MANAPTAAAPSANAKRLTVRAAGDRWVTSRAIGPEFSGPGNDLLMPRIAILPGIGAGKPQFDRHLRRGMRAAEPFRPPAAPGGTSAAARILAIDADRQEPPELRGATVPSEVESGPHRRAQNQRPGIAPGPSHSRHLF